jgi:hypothetical protein
VVEMLEQSHITYIGLKREQVYARKKMRIHHVFTKIDILNSGFKVKTFGSDLKNYNRLYVKMLTEDYERKLVDYKHWNIISKFNKKELDATHLKSDKTGSFFEVRCNKTGEFLIELYLGEERLDSINVECSSVK